MKDRPLVEDGLPADGRSAIEGRTAGDSTLSMQGVGELDEAINERARIDVLDAAPTC